ncbi:hypothetical protein [Salinibacter sp. 10B]|uniref:hypothetical protein n=1 Tax=Salinibacter sp. 10B TaxID=1923971 RepID=UPI0011B07187|nr:hypothetical protein [Salinibacter sp. 10B]
MIVLMMIASLSAAEPLQAQTRADRAAQDSLSLLERYQRARIRLLAREVLSGSRPLRVLPPKTLPTQAPPLVATAAASDTSTTVDAPPPFPLDDVRRVRDLERSWFLDRYSNVEWAYYGSGTRINFIDTARTRDLRARLQAQFGDPTRTFADVYSNEWARAPDSTREEPIQFSYWFVVNGGLPVRVTDVDGQQGRGLIVSTRRSHRDRLPALRAALLEPLREGERAPYVDYVYVEQTNHYFRVGFDGQDFFRERISRFDIVSGRRPRLDARDTNSSPERASNPAPSSP